MARQHEAPIHKLRPTQITIGFIEVGVKRKELEALKKHQQRDFLAQHMIPAVYGPDGRVHITDHHHLARALLADPWVLILDEPTAHLDEQNSRALMRDLLAVTGSRSLLLITHDLADLDQLDEIIVLAGGKVAERGTHEQLLAARGLYYRMGQASRPAAAGVPA